MATNLLLEGDDLEALLLKAHSEGGPNARIVRADKYRHGGVWGFFARERFEVAVEIPQPVTDEGAAFFVEPAVAVEAAAPDAAGAGAVATAPADVLAPVVAAAPSSRHAFRPAGTAAAQRFVDHLEGFLATGPTLLPTTAEPLAAAVEAPAPAAPAPVVAAPVVAEPPAPTAFAAQALLGLADRVSAAERSAVRAVRERYASTEVDLPAEPVLADLPAELVPAGQVAELAAELVTAGVGAAPRGSADQAVLTATRTVIPAPVAGHLPTISRVTTSMTSTDPGLEAPADVPHEPGLSPAQPSTSRPEFTALLNTLRAGSRPGRSPRGGSDAPSTPATPPPSTPFAPFATSGPSPDDPEATASLTLPPEATGAPQHPVAAIPSPRSAEAGEDELPDVAQRQNDPRTAADRSTLRALGVPAAWTRLLRPGDRFAEVLRMLERMPEADVDPATPIVAVVGPAGSVRAEAYRTALDLAADGEPRPVVVVPSSVGPDRAAAVAKALRSGPVVLAVESDGDDPALVLDTLTTVQAGAVVAVVDAASPLERTQRWLDALGQVDAVVVDGATRSSQPAAVLQLGLPVVRLDGIPVDHVTWTALLCAQLALAEQAAGER